MSRGGAVVVVLLAAAFAVVLLRRCSRDGGGVPDAGAPTMSAAEKARIQRFWTARRAATDYQRAGRFAAAIREHRAALQQDPDHEGSLYDLANCYIELDRFAEALPLLEQLVTVHPHSQRGHLQIGLIHSAPAAGAAFDLAAAERALRRAFEINQEETGALLRLAGVTLVRGDEARAAELYALANRSNFRAVEGYYLRAYVRWKQGRPAAAAALLAEAVRQSAVPRVVAGVPGEGDTRPGQALPATSVASKRLLRPFWDGLADRLGAGPVPAAALAGEFRELDAALGELRRRAGSR